MLDFVFPVWQYTIVYLGFINEFWAWIVWAVKCNTIWSEITWDISVELLFLAVVNLGQISYDPYARPSLLRDRNE